MKKTWKLLICFCVALVLFSVAVKAEASEIWDGTVADRFAGGSGTEEDPYLIENGAQLAHIGKSGHYKLTADIYLNDTANWENWTAENGPANVWTPLCSQDQFGGTLDGDGHTIYGLYVSVSSDNAGLFARAFHGTFKSINIEQSSVFGVGSIGSLVGNAAKQSTFINCVNSGYVTATGENTGGLVGQAYDNSRFVNCSNFGTIKNINKDYNENSTNTVLHTAGIVGQASRTEIESCTNSGEISSYGSQVGGIVGEAYNGTRITDCNNNGEILCLASEGHDPNDFGGIAGALYRNTVISNCKNHGDVTSHSYRVGGIAGGIGESCSVVDAQNDGTISGYETVGGIVGTMWSGCTIEGCENKGAVVGVEGKYDTPFRIGGILGQSNDEDSVVKNSVNHGAVSGTYHIGGVVGALFNGTIDCCQNDATVSGSSDLGGIVGELNTGFVRNCSNSGSIAGDIDSNNCGGIVGVLSAKAQGVMNCRNTGAVSGNSSVGGICGNAYNYSLVLNCWNSGTASVTNEYANAGSIIGRIQECTITHCFYLPGTCANMTTVTDSMEEISEDMLKTSDFLSALNTWVSENQRPTTGYAAWETDAAGYPAPSGAVPAYTPVEGTLHLQATEHGTAALSADKAMTETTVTVTLTPAEGYIPYQVWYQAAEDPETCVCAKANGDEFTFSMPYGDADVYATFFALPDNPVWDGTVAGEFAGGDGTENNPYLIGNAPQLAHLRDFQYQQKHFRLIANIALNDTADWENWTSNESTLNKWAPISGFNGTLDGDGHSITGLYTDSTKSKQGLFQQIQNNGCVKNLTIDRSVVLGTESVGSIAGYNSGSIVRCTNNGKVSSSERYCGGIAGRSWDNESLIEECVNNGEIYSERFSVGGITGDSCGHVRSCVNNGDITGTALTDTQYPNRSFPVAGIAGEASGMIVDCKNAGCITGYYGAAGIASVFSDGEIEDCVNNGTITCLHNDANENSGCQVGGIASSVGRDAQIHNCVNKGQVSGTERVGGICGLLGYDNQAGTARVVGCANYGAVTADYNVGGIAGLINGNRNTPVVEQCLNQGSVTAKRTTDFDFAGGLVGYAQARNSGRITIRNSYNTGVISGYQCLGGLAGEVRSRSGGGVCLVENCYSIGAVTGQKAPMSGVVARINTNEEGCAVTVQNCYCLSGTASADITQNGNAGTKTITNVQILTSAQMGKAGSFEGFDFETVWLSAGDGSYPTLRAVMATGQMGEFITYTEYINGDLVVEAKDDLTAPIYVMEASYDESGQMLECKMVELTAGASKTLQLNEQGDCMKLFISTKQLQPLCEDVELN